MDDSSIENLDIIMNKLFSYIDNKNYHRAQNLIIDYNFIIINTKNEDYEGANLLTYLVNNTDNYKRHLFEFFEFFEFLVDNNAYFNKNIFIKGTRVLYENKFIELLLDKKFKIKLRNDENPICISKPLHFIVKYKNYNYLKYLLSDNDFKDKVEDKEILSLIHYVIHEKKDTKALQLLLDYRMNNFKKDKNGKTPMMYAVESKNEEIVEMILRNGFQINETDNNGETALFYSVKDKNFKMMKFLIDKGADVEVKNNNSENVLFPAVHAGKIGILEYLLKLVKNKNLRNKENLTILYYAKKNNKKNIINLLKKNKVTE